MRLVGYVEYQAAMDQFDALLKMASETELAVMNEIVRERPEYTVTIQGTQSEWTILNSPAWGQPTNERQLGLDWVIALARVEMATTLASFVYVYDSFAVVKPKEYDREAYRTLVLDGLKYHMQLLNDQGLLQAMQNPLATTRVLAILRRIELADSLHSATVQLYDKDLTSEQLVETQKLYERLQVAKQGVLQNLLARIR
ncbi:MAG: hypothetical protein AAF483_12540 [Planctomycetota bacterium]